MNEHHAQFFRELRELMAKYKVAFDWADEPDFEGAWFFVDGVLYAAEKGKWPNTVWRCAGKYGYVEIDTPQKEGEK